MARPARTRSSSAKFVPYVCIVLLGTLCGPAFCYQSAAGSQQNLSRIQVLLQRGDLASAETQLWDVVEKNPENERAIDLLGDIRVKQERFPEAEALYKRAVAIAPRSAQAYEDLGKLYLRLNRDDEAKSALTKAHEFAPNNPSTSIALAEVYQNTGEFQRSLELINAIPPRLRPASVLPVLAADYFGLKQSDSVPALTPAVLKAAPGDPTIVPRFARVLIQNGFVEDAGKILKIAQTRQKITPEFLMTVATVQEQLGDEARARQTLAEAVKQDPKSVDALMQAARAASKAHEWNQELAFLQQVLAIQPNHSEALRHLVVTQMRAGAAKKAVTTAHELVALQPNDPDALQLLSAALVNDAQWHSSRPVVEKLLALRESPNVHVMMGMVLMNDGDIEGASKQFDTALQQEPDNADAGYYRAVVLRQRGNLPEALKQLEKVVAAHPDHGQAQGELGVLALQLGDLERARKALERSVVLQPEIPENHYQLSLVYRRLGVQDKARVEMAEYQRVKDAAGQKGKDTKSPQ